MKAPTFLVAVLVFLGCVETTSAAEPVARVQLAVLEEQMQQIIDDATPSIVGLVISHASYGDAAINRRKPGQLGGYRPINQDRMLPGGAPLLAKIDRLDLSNPANIAEHQFASGIVLDAPQRLILTTYHVIEGATKVYVRSCTGKGSYANIIGADSRSDLAVLKLIDPVSGLKSATLGTARLVEGPNKLKPNLKRGSWIIALGHPLASGLSDGTPSASWGILSNIRRRSHDANPQEDNRANKPLYQYGSLLQTDARITLGSSGAALLNKEGEVIGIGSSVAAVAGSESQGGFAVPLDKNYRRIIDVLMKGQEVEYGFLGVLPISDRTGIGGVSVELVTPGCPAAVAGLLPGDTIRSVDGNVLNDPDDLLQYVGSALAGTPTALTINRKGKDINVEVVLAKNNIQMNSIVTMPAPSFAGLRVDYSSIRYLQLFTARETAGRQLPLGVAIREIEPNSEAERRFKNAGDRIVDWIITHVDGTAVSKPADFFKLAEGKSSIKLTLVNPRASGQSTTVILP